MCCCEVGASQPARPCQRPRILWFTSLSMRPQANRSGQRQHSTPPLGSRPCAPAAIGLAVPGRFQRRRVSPHKSWWGLIRRRLHALLSTCICWPSCIRSAADRQTRMAPASAVSVNICCFVVVAFMCLRTYRRVENNTGHKGSVAAGGHSRTESRQARGSASVRTVRSLIRRTPNLCCTAAAPAPKGTTGGPLEKAGETRAN